ncbi:glucans biosynthesis glucosyltransferase MdoH [Roseiarcus sp.]|uniref:glucans biosynthesis glucosyltransferase MdoH n=1 Tax=Roseiarcus sp. TaxID=1969460 RepID=UPI003F9B5873
MALSMESVTLRPAEAPGDAGPSLGSSLGASMPGYAPLAMPAQSFRKFSKSQRRAWIHPDLAATPILARLGVFGGAIALTLYGVHQMYKVVGVGTTTALEWVLVVLFAITFSWLSLSFTASVVGFVWLIVHSRKRFPLPASLSERTAVVMPIYNEAPSRVFGAMQAIIEDVERTGLGGAFDYLFLSDTTDGNVWIAEERAFLAMRERLPAARVYYRRRRKNTSRKAGNIGDFVTRWGGHYAHMLVLDADSVMSGDAVVRLAAAMEADPDSGIIQSLPLIINRNTMFARVQQFAARIAGPVFAAGLAAWMGRDGNYWGHNAIIRTRAFADHCGLPDLPGRPPFGGHILSHDFVEAALIRRAGYFVYMLPTLGGSYEESPPSLIDLAARDRRWCQGNLQHSRVIGARGFVWATRQHFATGIMGYLASPLWMLQLLVGIVLVLQSHYIRPEYFTADFSLFPAWPRFDYERALQLFALTIAILLAPKFLGLILALADGPTRRGSGGALALISSTLIEILISAALAPIMMMFQSGSVLQILSGRDTGWNPQRRDDGSIPFTSIARRHRSHALLGVVTLFAAALISPSLVLWMSPTIAGLVLSIPLSWASGQLWIGLGLKRIGLLLTPEETAPPPVVQRANALAEELARTGRDHDDAVLSIHANAEFRAIHEAFLPEKPRHRLGEVDVDAAVATVKLNDAETVEDACAWLKPKERVAVLADRALIAMLVRLPHAEEQGRQGG